MEETKSIPIPTKVPSNILIENGLSERQSPGLHTTDEPLIESAKPVEEHNEYFFKIVIFCVENTLFKVPCHHFEQDSDIFRDMFSLPRVDGAPVEGETKENPIHLTGITKADFESFLTVICPKHFQRQAELPLKGWVSVLKLSTVWNFQAVRSLAITKITPLTVNPIERIEHARTYGVKAWHWISLFELALMSRPFSHKEIDRLGLNFCFRVAELRGRVVGSQIVMKGSSSNAPAYTTSVDHTLASFISDLFSDEVAGVPYGACSSVVKESCRQLLRGEAKGEAVSDKEAGGQRAKPSKRKKLRK